MIRVGTIGTSSITGTTLEASRAVKGLAFTTASSRDAAKAAAFASDHGLDAGVTTEALLASDAVDAVYVASPNAVHEGQVRAALEVGLHVLCEKPAVDTAAEWDDLCALARERGLVLLETMRTAHDPVMLRVQELLPSLGVLRGARLHLSQRSSRYDQVLAGEHVNIFDPALSGGALRDLGVYATHAAVQLFGVPRTVQAALVPVASGADGAGTALLGYEGAVVTLGWSKITFADVPCTIEGEDGTLTFDHLTEMRSLTVQYRDGRRIEESPDKHPATMTYALERFVHVVAGEADAAVDQQRTHDSLALLERIQAEGVRVG